MTSASATAVAPARMPAAERSLARAMIKMRADRTRRDMREFRDRIQGDLSAHEPMPESSIPIAIEQIKSAAAASLDREK